MRKGLLVLSVALLTGLLAAQSPSRASLAITIDDLGDTIQVTSNSTSSQILTGTGSTVTDALGNTYCISGPSTGCLTVERATIVDPGLVSSANEGVVLLEPSTGLISDELAGFTGVLIAVSDVEGQTSLSSMSTARPIDLRGV